MKKIFFCLVFALVTQFTFAEAIISPMFGYGLYTGSIKDKTIPLKVDNKYSAFDMGLSLGYVKDTGFTFWFDYQVMLKNKIHYTYYKNNLPDTTQPGVDKNGKATYNKPFMWDINILFGYTFKVADDKLYLSIALGPSMGAGMRGWEHDKYFFYGGGAFRFGVDYYFLDWLGVGLSLTDSLGYAGGNHPVTNAHCGGIGNLFQIKFGPKFKL